MSDGDEARPTPIIVLASVPGQVARQQPGESLRRWSYRRPTSPHYVPMPSSAFSCAGSTGAQGFVFCTP